MNDQPTLQTIGAKVYDFSVPTKSRRHDPPARQEGRRWRAICGEPSEIRNPRSLSDPEYEDVGAGQWFRVVRRQRSIVTSAPTFSYDRGYVI
jgi:hypothetical protein